MRKLILNLFLFISFLILGIYLSIPFLIKNSLQLVFKESPYDLTIEHCTYQFPKIEIKEIQLLHKENKEKIIISNLSFLTSFSKIIKGEIIFSNLLIEKINGFNTDFENITGQGEFSLVYNHLKGELNLPFIQSLTFDVTLSKNKSIFLAAELGSNPLYEKAFITMKADKNIETRVFLKNVKSYAKNFGNIMISSQGKFLENMKIDEGTFNILSSLVKAEGEFSLLEQILSYKIYSIVSLFEFLGRQEFTFDGQYSLFDKEINSIVKSYFENQKHVQIDGKITGNPFSSVRFIPESIQIDTETFFFPKSKKIFYINLNPFSMHGDLDILITDMNKLEGIVFAKTQNSFLKIKGQFDDDKYILILEGKDLLLWELLKATDFNVELKGIKNQGSINASLRNKEKTNLNFKTTYLLNDEQCVFIDPLLQGTYRETFIKTNKAQIQISSNQGIQSEAELGIGSQGTVFLKGKVNHSEKEISVKADYIPIIILNSIVTNQNIFFESGILSLNMHYSSNMQNALDLTTKISNLKTSLFEETLAEIQGSATIHSNKLQSDIQMQWDKKGVISLNYATSDLERLSLDSLYHPLKTSFQFKGYIDIDGFTDVLQMHDDDLSGKLKFLAAKKENEPISIDIELQDGYLEHLNSGIEIKEIKASLKKNTLSPETILLLEGYDDGEGKIFAEGKFLVDLIKKDITGNGKIALSLFKILNMDRYQGSATGTLHLQLLPNDKKISGSLKIDNFLGYMIPKKTSEFFDIKVTSKEETKNPIEHNSTPEMSNQTNSETQILLNIHLAIPDTLRFYGNGLESTWGGNLGITGTLAHPNIQGKLNTTDGYFVFAGKKLPFIEGSLVFTNGIDPIIHVVTDTKASNIDAKIIYHGSLSDPKLELISIPALPREEILAQVMFSKSASQVKSISQVLQLADAIAIFSGNPSITGFLDDLQKVSGIDEIGIREDSINSLFTSPTASTDAGVLSMAKNLSEDLFIRGERTLSVDTADSKFRGIIGIKLIPDVSLEGIAERSDVNNSSLQSAWDYGIGIEWKKDY